jgi:hypothetical protein
MHPDEGLVDDVQTRARQQRMHVGHPAIGGILHREHAQIDLARATLSTTSSKVVLGTASKSGRDCWQAWCE